MTDTEKRFYSYASFPTMSVESSQTFPSTQKQLLLADFLKKELSDMGLCDVIRDEKGYVYATLKANCDKERPVIGFISHLDTSEDAPDSPIKMKTLLYEGGDIVLNEEKGIVLSPNDYPALSSYIGQHLIVSDGTTLIGADDKGGITAIMQALKKLISSNIEHGDIKIAFTPDEEVGRGTDYFDIEGFGCDFAYTVDGGALGEIEYENFNAASAKIVINGVSIHPGDAFGKMKNASLIATEFNSLLPPEAIPAKTREYEGFFHLTRISGDIERAALSYIIRDHDMQKFEQKKALIRKAAETINDRYGKNTLELTVTDSYFNMKEIIEKNYYIIERVISAMNELGVTPKIIPIRGGTDGARLSFMGLPCPNICTGGENFHSRFEYISVESMEKISDIIVLLASKE